MRLACSLIKTSLDIAKQSWLYYTNSFEFFSSFNKWTEWISFTFSKWTLLSVKNIQSLLLCNCILRISAAFQLNWISSNEYQCKETYSQNKHPLNLSNLKIMSNKFHFRKKNFNKSKKIDWISFACCCKMFTMTIFS